MSVMVRIYTSANTPARYTEFINNSFQKFMLVLITLAALVITPYKFRLILYIRYQGSAPKVKSIQFTIPMV